jgi:hypothetical protein
MSVYGSGVQEEEISDFSSEDIEDEEEGIGIASAWKKSLLIQ